MKTTKHNLNAIAMGIALAIGSVSAASAANGRPTPDHPGGPAALAALQAELNPNSNYPTFDASERTGIALVESALSLIAARTHIDPNFCAPKDYNLSVNAIDADGDASITFPGGGAALHAHLTEGYLGAFVDVEAAHGSSLYGSKIKNYKGDHQWSRLNNIFLDHAVWDFKHPQSKRLIAYDEHSVKDYYKQILGAPRPIVEGAGADLCVESDISKCGHLKDPESWEFDQGIEVITKKNYPVAKWGELSWYRQNDGVDGVVQVRKLLVAKESCEILYKAGGFVPFEYSGTVTVRPFKMPFPTR